MKTAMLCVLSLGLCGCAGWQQIFHPQVGLIDPQPNVFLKPSTESLALSIGPDVADSVEISDAAAKNGLARGVSLRLERWHGSLSNGFHGAFDRYFAQASAAPSSTFELLQAAPSIIVGEHSLLTLRYRAQLRDSSGAITQRFAGTVVLSAVGQSAADVVRMSIERMYEEIAQRMS
jgi:hypothetical protein